MQSHLVIINVLKQNLHVFTYLIFAKANRVCLFFKSSIDRELGEADSKTNVKGISELLSDCFACLGTQVKDWPHTQIWKTHKLCFATDTVVCKKDSTHFSLKIETEFKFCGEKFLCINFQHSH